MLASIRSAVEAHLTLRVPVALSVILDAERPNRSQRGA